jgi:hypothetical protein
MMSKHGHFFFPFAINRFKCTSNSFTVNKLNVIQWSKSFNICNRNNQVHLSLFSYLELSIFIVLLKIFIIESLKSFENYFASKLPKQQISQKNSQKIYLFKLYSNIRYNSPSNSVKFQLNFWTTKIISYPKFLTNPQKLE